MAAAKGAIELQICLSGCIELHVAMEQNRSAQEIDKDATDQLATSPSGLVADLEKLCGGEHFQSAMHTST
jgi:hypothetical protein